MNQAARQVQKALAQPRDTGPMPWEEPPLPRGERDEPCPRLDEVLLAQARLLGHDWRAAWKSASGAEVLGWSSDDNPQGLVVPFLLLWLSGSSSPEKPPRSVEELWSKTLENSLAYDPWSTEEEARELSERLSRAYGEVITALSVSHPQQEELLEGCLKVARERARAIVREKHRRSYGKAALLLAACAEVLQRRGQPARAQEFLRRFREEFLATAPSRRSWTRQCISIENRSPEYRGNLLAHGQPPPADMLAIIVPDRLYIWRSSDPPHAPPAYEIDTHPLLAPYFERIGVRPEQIQPMAFEALVSWWLTRPHRAARARDASGAGTLALLRRFPLPGGPRDAPGILPAARASHVGCAAPRRIQDRERRDTHGEAKTGVARGVGGRPGL
ncbi:hypothetical protein ACN28S_60295 [Cystobacter fuscus]